MAKTPEKSSYRNLLRMRIPCAGEPVFKARARLAKAVRRLGFRGETVDGILLAFTEAVTNAVIHGSAPGCRCVRTLVGVENGRLVIEVIDHGRGFHPDAVELPPLDCMCEGGRGLFLMRALMDEVEWNPTSSGTVVRMVKCCVSVPPLPEPAPSASAAASATPLPASN